MYSFLDLFPQFSGESVTLSSWWRLGWILLFFLAAWGIHRVADYLVSYLMKLNRLTIGDISSPERRRTLRGLYTSFISFLVFLLATLFSLALFVQTDTIIWMVGLFSAAFGLGARPLISDYLTGLGFLFEDTLDVGEKVELLVTGGPIDGVIEAVNMRVTLLRSSTGELYTIPNGEIRVIRNFSRGRFSMTKVVFNVAGQDIENALGVLDGLGTEAVSLLPNLLEPWDVLSSDGAVGPHTELTVVAKARFGQAAKMRPRLLSLVQKRLADANIELVG